MPSFFKIILIGDPAVGKTSIQRNYFGQNFQENYIQTLGADFAVKKLGEDTMQVWDLAGQANYDVFRNQYFKGTRGAIIVFDITNPESLDNINFWYEEIETILGYAIPVTVVGNKIDLRDDRKIGSKTISEKDGKKKASEIMEAKNADFEYMESSALTGINVHALFSKLAERVKADIAKEG